MASQADKSPMDPKKLEENIGDHGYHTGAAHGVLEPDDVRNADGSSITGDDILALQDLDPVMNMKMHLVNNVSELQCESRGVNLWLLRLVS